LISCLSFITILPCLFLVGEHLGVNTGLARQALYHLRHSASLFLCWGFRDRVSRTVCWSGFETAVLLISAPE
jgi:hypothetical protein